MSAPRPPAGLISDPIDKVTTFTVYLILRRWPTGQGALPQGDGCSRRPRPDRSPPPLVPLGRRDQPRPSPQSIDQGGAGRHHHTALAILVGGLLGPALLAFFAVLMPALVASILGRLADRPPLLTLPIALGCFSEPPLLPAGRGSYSGWADPRHSRGAGSRWRRWPASGAISGAVTLFPTRPLRAGARPRRRGVSPGVASWPASVQAVPALVERAATITAAQRARGLDTEGSLWRQLGCCTGRPGTADHLLRWRSGRWRWGRGYPPRPPHAAMVAHRPDRQRLARWLLVAAQSPVCSWRARGPPAGLAALMLSSSR